MSEQEQNQAQQAPPVCPLFGVQTFPVKGNVTSITREPVPQLQDRFHPCLGPQCAWYMRVTETQGSCSIPVLAGSVGTMAGWEWTETQDPPEGEDGNADPGV